MSLANITGQPVKIEIDGQEFLLSPLTVGDFAALEAHIRQERIDAYKTACAGLDPVIIATGIEHIIKEQVDVYDSSISSTIFLLWRSISKKHGMTLEEASELVTVKNMSEITGIIKAIGAPEKNLKGAEEGD